MEAARETAAAAVEQAKAALQTHGERLLRTLGDAGLVPGPAAELVPEGFRPATRLGVSYGGRAVDLGSLFRVRETAVQPVVSFQREAGVDHKTSYTLMLVDPDAPTPDDPRFAFWRHWVITGLEPLSGEGEMVAATKRPATAYHPPGPTKEYLFVLFREPVLHGLDLRPEDVGGDEFTQRRSFRPAELARKHGLELVGVNWMRVAADDWE